MKKLFLTAAIIAASSMFLSGCGCGKKVDLESHTLKDYKGATSSKNDEIVNAFLDAEKIDKSYAGDFRNCLSEHAYTKSETLKTKDVLGWCKAEYDRDKNALSKKVNLDWFYSNFSSWDGSFRPLEKSIKENMNDPGSYEHVKTLYNVVLNVPKGNPYAIVKTTFRGKNAFGGVVPNTVTVKIDLKTQSIISVK